MNAPQYHRRRPEDEQPRVGENAAERQLRGLMNELRRFLDRRGVDAHVAAKRNDRGDQVIGIIIESGGY